MNRKNLTAAVLAGLAGAAGIAGTAQAVNMNPDGLGQVLIYPYYTSNDGNQTILSVVNTTDNAKAVKVRFLEGFNSREVLDFNLYLSAWDVWVAAIADDEGTPTLYIPDDSCTVPYLYGDFDGEQPFLSLAYEMFPDGGPTDIGRAAEGHFEVIEMGTIDPLSPSGLDITHTEKYLKDDDGDKIKGSEYWEPGDCGQLVKNWTEYTGKADGLWRQEAIDNSDCNLVTDPTKYRDDGCQAYTDTTRNTGGLFGGASIINPDNGTMFSYDARAIQGYDKTDDGVHYLPGLIHPSLNDGSERDATIFFGAPQNRAVTLESYGRPVDAISAVFMHEHIMNEYTRDPNLAAATEWVITFPTKSWYVDEDLLYARGSFFRFWFPDPSDPGCGGWLPGDFNPVADLNPDVGGKDNPNANPPTDWELCTFIYQDFASALPPFTRSFDGTACENARLDLWDRDERSPFLDTPSGSRPPVVSPSLPVPCDPTIESCGGAQFQLCYETNVLRFGDEGIFGTPAFGDDSNSLLRTVDFDDDEDKVPSEYTSGWGRIDFDVFTGVKWGGDGSNANLYRRHIDGFGLVGLPTTGFAAYEFENEFLGGGDVKAFYGGLFSHKGNVRREGPPVCDDILCFILEGGSD